MNTKIIALAVTSLFLIGGYAMYQFGLNQGSHHHPQPAITPAQQQPLYWHDPMVPGQKFDHPGKSPYMDMQLVPVYPNEAAEDKNSVSISPRMQQNLGIRTAEVTQGKLASNLVVVGNVVFNEADVALLQARSNGYVEQVYVRATLDPVSKGQTLADIVVPEWIAAQEDYLAIKHMHAIGTDDLLDAARQRMRLVGMNQVQINHFVASEKINARMALTSPINGVVTELNLRAGMTIINGANLFRINGLNTVWINAEVPENLAAQVHPGNLVAAHTEALPGIIFKGRVSAILPQVTTTTRTLTARIILDNPGNALLPGMFASITISSAAGKQDVLLIPSEAVIRTGTRSVVMLAQADGQFTPTEVETGRELQGQTEIRKGLLRGQKVVLSGQFLIDSEASLKATSMRMNDAPAEVNYPRAQP